MMPDIGLSMNIETNKSTGRVDSGNGDSGIAPFSRTGGLQSLHSGLSLPGSDIGVAPDIGVDIAPGAGGQEITPDILPGDNGDAGLPDDGDDFILPGSAGGMTTDVSGGGLDNGSTFLEGAREWFNKNKYEVLIGGGVALAIGLYLQSRK